MQTALKPLYEIVRLNEDLVLNCLDGLSEPDATARLTDNTNSIAFLVAHLADARHYLAKLLGRPLDNPLEATLGEVTTIEEAPDLPSRGELRRIWRDVSRHLDDCFESVSAESLAAEAGQPFPLGDPSLLAGIAFLLQHESYHLGQIALIRKALGRGAMSYERRSDS